MEILSLRKETLNPSKVTHTKSIYTDVLHIVINIHTKHKGGANIQQQRNKEEMKKRLFVMISTDSLTHLLLSCSGSLPLRQETTPQGDILGRHSMRASPPTLTSV